MHKKGADAMQWEPRHLLHEKRSRESQKTSFPLRNWNMGCRISLKWAFTLCLATVSRAYPLLCWHCWLCIYLVGHPEQARHFLEADKHFRWQRNGRNANRSALLRVVLSYHISIYSWSLCSIWQSFYVMWNSARTRTPRVTEMAEEEKGNGNPIYFIGPSRA